MDIEQIRNFCIIAHIDHGKSTLADRMMEFTGAVTRRESKDRMLDTLELEQERGITIKLQTVRLNYNYTRENSKSQSKNITSGVYVLNLIDTPGHVDFSYEVSRSVAASEGALLLIDATQGIQAQTLTTVYKAMEYDLTIIPILNKVDLPNADVDRVKLDVIETFGFDEKEIILASGKTGEGIKDILDEIVQKISPPGIEGSIIYNEDSTGLSKSLIFDAFYHEYKGVVALMKVIKGQFRSSDLYYLIGTNTKIDPVEIGYLTPKMIQKDTISEGEVGYIATGLKDINKVHSGDTVTIYKTNNLHKRVKPLEGYVSPKPMVYASLYPVEASDYTAFAEAIEKLSLNDAALTYQKEYSQALGSGFVCGFLGLLHLEITQDRLEREFGINLISTTPTVEFKVKLSTNDYSKLPGINVANIDPKTNIAVIRTASEFPEGSLYDEVFEPWVKVEILSPERYVGDIMELCQKHRGVYKSMNFLTRGVSSSRHAVIIYELPTVEIIVNFFDSLKSVTNGYASMDYSFIGYRQGNIVKIGVLVNEEVVEAMSFLTHKESAERKARSMVEKLKEIIPRQNFRVPLQAAIGGKIIARETIPAYRKDVTAKLYGGDVTRKMKLLKKQKKGKQRMKMFGSVEIPKEAFLAALKAE